MPKKDANGIASLPASHSYEFGMANMAITTVDMAIIIKSEEAQIEEKRKKAILLSASLIFNGDKKRPSTFFIGTVLVQEMQWDGFQL